MPRNTPWHRESAIGSLPNGRGDPSLYLEAHPVPKKEPGPLTQGTSSIPRRLARYLHATVRVFHLLGQGHHERLLEVTGVHEGDGLHPDGLYDRQDPRAPSSVPGQGGGHHRRHGQRHAEGLHSRGRGEYFSTGGLDDGMLNPGEALRCEDWNFSEEGEFPAEGGELRLLTVRSTGSICIPCDRTSGV
ncbi:hypothetical protein MDA_GLEAN10002421 [Myotis davidii]|uniref:Uncharacterized protein n=1 Tax=Myotis davidii TaxID=225400 RepID=L5M5S6_MYODS|nr:hypothetical protein MDA_GLEAN10002421 [Myotis davidii]